MKSSHVYSGSIIVALVMYAIGLAFSASALYLAVKIVKYAWFY